MKFRIIVMVYLSSSVVVGQQISETTRRDLLKGQDMRDATRVRLYLSHESASLRAEACVAAGCLQDTSLIRPLMGLLRDSDLLTREAAGFALGQMNNAVDSLQRREISDALMSSLREGANEKTTLKLIEALGKTGDVRSLDELVLAGWLLKDPGMSREIALSIGRYAYRGVESASATRFAAAMLSNGDWESAYALWRIGEKSLIDEHAAKLVAAVSNKDPDVRMFAASALGRMQDSESVRTLTDLLSSDVDWRVRVNAAKSLRRFDSTAFGWAVPALILAASDTNEHVSLVAMASLSDLKLRSTDWAQAVRKTLVEALVNTRRYSGRQRREAALSLAKQFNEDAYPVLAGKYRSHVLEKSGYIEALGYCWTIDAVQELLRFGREGNPRTRYLVLEALTGLSGKMSLDSSSLHSVRSLFVKSLRSDDAVVLTAAAIPLGDSILRTRSAVGPLIKALQRRGSVGDPEAIVALITVLEKLGVAAAAPALEKLLDDRRPGVAMHAARCLQKLTGRSYVSRVSQASPPLHTDFDWRFLARLKSRPVVEVHTSRGSFRIILFPDEAPFTCLNFGKLLERGFYNGLIFHRVVPNFVVQGGDPQGTGWGGPGYTMRSEFGYSVYNRGMVGIASSGKDTEGSQFFVTHSRQPHLDGRYTVLGRVVAGMDVVDLLQVGDKIVRMSFVNDVPAPRGN